MTSSSATNPARPRRRGGFTLVEMLTAIGIIILLVALILPAVNHAWKRAIRTRMKADLETLTAALEAYRADMRMYPTIDYDDTSGVYKQAANPGATVLCWALLGMGSGKQDGFGATTANPPQDAQMPGFKIRPQGQTYGPYIEINTFKLGHDTQTSGPKALTGSSASGWSFTGTSNASGEPDYFFEDRYGHPILYFHANLNANIQQATPTYGFVASVNASGTAATALPMYNFNDNYNPSGNGAACAMISLSVPSYSTSAPQTAAQALASMAIMLGDTSGLGAITVGEIPATTHPFLLWSAGPDEQFGLDTSSPQASGGSQGPGNYPNAANAAANCDDVTNFSP